MTVSRALLILLLMAACAASGPAVSPNQKEWDGLVTEYEQFQALRRSAPAAPESAPRKEQIEKLLESLRRLEGIYSPFMDRLAEYYTRTGDRRAAELYSREKIRIGDLYMDVLSRYDRAIIQYEEALKIDPSNGEAQTKIDIANARRYIQMESFAAIEPGMKEEHVRKVLGMPREDWIKQVIQNRRVYSVWIYPKKDGGASAVYFDNGVVYQTNWNAAQAVTEGESATERSSGSDSGNAGGSAN